MITQDYQVLTPVYGRDYKNKLAVETDFRNGKDFVLNSLGDQTYCSIKDFNPGVKVNLRYKKLMSVCIVSV